LYDNLCEDRIHHSMNKASIIIIDDQADNRDLLCAILKDAGYAARTQPNGPMGIASIMDAPPDVILLDISMPHMDGFEVAARLKQDPVSAGIPIIFVSALDEIDQKVRAFESGGVDYVEKPVTPQEVLARVKTHVSLRRLQESLQAEITQQTADLREAHKTIEELNGRLTLENEFLREEVNGPDVDRELIGGGARMMLVQQQIDLVAPTRATALILGESGTGKELVARAIHARSPRSQQAMIKVNCASIPKELFESEFFGHVRGSFTGAIKDREGRFAAADKGTLFLDEIGEIPLALQGKLLRVLQEGQYERVGEERTRAVDVRVIAATNRDLRREVAEGRFREDLYFRLNVYPVPLPPLRERPEDVPDLARHFAQEAAAKLGTMPLVLTAADLELLQSYSWPGNVRELQNIVERAAITGGPVLLPVATRGTAARSSAASPHKERVYTEQEMRDMERENIQRALKLAGGKVAGPGGAAELLGIRSTTLSSRLAKWGLK
jgi:DNA-binding NtrC family response regulator